MWMIELNYFVFKKKIKIFEKIEDKLLIILESISILTYLSNGKDLVS